MSTGESIGMMEGAFFVSKGVILEWMNELLDVSVKTRDSVASVVATIMNKLS
jgi:predicted nucleic-acid-binding protein